MENQEQQRILEESLAEGAELKEKCMVEQQETTRFSRSSGGFKGFFDVFEGRNCEELNRLKQIWSDTQPELPLGASFIEPQAFRFASKKLLWALGFSKCWRRAWSSSSP